MHNEYIRSRLDHPHTKEKINPDEHIMNPKKFTPGQSDIQKEIVSSNQRLEQMEYPCNAIFFTKFDIEEAKKQHAKLIERNKKKYTGGSLKCYRRKSKSHKKSHKKYRKH